jgi:hypothetical protein
MKLYLPEKKEWPGIGISLVILIGVFIIGMCIKANDACHGRLGQWLDSLLEWLVNRQRR